MKNEKYLEKAIECLDNMLISNDQTWESEEEKGKYQSVMRDCMNTTDGCANTHSKVRAIRPEIIVSGNSEKPYYEISYYDVSDHMWHVGYGSYNLDYVEEWLRDCFEVVSINNDDKELDEAILHLGNTLNDHEHDCGCEECRKEHEKLRDCLIELKFRRELTGQRVCKYQMMNKDYPDNSVLCLYTSEPCTMCIFKDSGTYKKAEAESDGV